MSLIRRSPVKFTASPAVTNEQSGWHVVIEYQGQGEAPYLVDLSHVSKWDLQGRDLSGFSPGGLIVPETPGASFLAEGWLINRMNATQASVWWLGQGEGQRRPDPAAEPAYTETTDAQAFLTLIGPGLPDIVETITSMDLFAPGVAVPALFQGPVLRIPCQVALLGKNEGAEAVIVAFPRGYGQTMAEAMLEAGAPYGLSPGGEGVFRKWLTSVG